jgi:hypothetical protein
MKKLLLLLMMLTVFLTACAGEPNQLPELLTPTPKSSEDMPTATLQSLTEADIVVPTPSGKSLQPKLAEADISLDEVVALLPPDAIPAILPNETEDIMVTADQANAAGIDPEGRVIGVSINGDSRAYPIPFLSRHEIVNDEVGGRLIAATW